MPILYLTSSAKPARLAPFLALSALLHVVVFVVAPAPAKRAGDEPVLQLALTQLPNALPRSTEKGISPSPRPKPPAAKEETRAPPPVFATEPVNEPRSIPVQESPRPRISDSSEQSSPSEPSDSGNSLTSDAAVLSQVRAALTHHFDYPLLARRRGWQGEVLLGFSLTPEGRIEGVEVVRSSGHKLLDEAACSSLARVGNLHNYMPPGSPRRLQIPVIYRLAEG